MKKSRNKTQEQLSKQMVVLRTVCFLSTWLANTYVTQHTCTSPFVPYTALRNQALKITVTNRSITSKLHIILEYSSLKLLQKCLIFLGKKFQSHKLTQEGIKAIS